MEMWKMPSVTAESFRTGLRIRNTLAGRQTVEFVPAVGRRVNWYICGPTVYSDSHLGHAKTYLCFDIIRKILVRHFRYDVHQIMNITNIDDKIIAASNEKSENYFDFAARWERDFFEVMGALGVDLPDQITRVNEFVPEIIAFIERIMEKGFAYHSNGSVYFDIQAFKHAGHHYPRLRPCAADEESQPPTESDVFDDEASDFGSEKRFRGDFVLWKCAKPGEPEWDSPWGKGRPGWHIECSAMCASTLPAPIDLHSGGDDLMFPHHSNEIAQSEAYYGIHQWINYFNHTGRMNINGQKMSKSLKNFIKIREVLKTTPPRILRLFYALTRYNDVINLDLSSRFGMSWDIDAKIANFFQTIAARSRAWTEALVQSQKFDQEDRRLESLLLEFPDLVHKAFCDDFNTKEALSVIQSTVSAVNVYLEAATPKLVLMRMAVERVRTALTSMGLVYDYSASNESFDGVVDAAVRFRHEVKAAVRSGNTAEILALCDQFRDVRLLPFGVKVEDGDTPTWKLCNVEEEQARKAHGAQPKGVPATPSSVNDLWKDTKYSKHQLDENGIPTADANGTPVSAKDRQYCEKKVNEFLKKRK